jgi:hypothetical protein
MDSKEVKKLKIGDVVEFKGPNYHRTLKIINIESDGICKHKCKTIFIFNDDCGRFEDCSINWNFNSSWIVRKLKYGTYKELIMEAL